MSTNQNFTFRRFEFKYHIPSVVCDRLIPELMNYMVWDTYVGDEEYYDVHSIYFDSPDFKCYHEKIDGIMSRKKPRLRVYDRDVKEGSDLFLEIKRKSGDVILKDRVVLGFDEALGLFENPFALVNSAIKNEAFVNEFVYDYVRWAMQPAVLVSYKRKPFFSKFDKQFRVTFDYDIKVADVKSMDFSERGNYINDDIVIMEVKFNGAMPRWFHDIIERYSLNKDTFSKYCSAVDGVHGVPDYF